MHLHDPAIVLLGMILEKWEYMFTHIQNLYLNTYSGFVHNSKIVQTIQMLFNMWGVEKNLVYTYIKILLSN